MAHVDTFECVAPVAGIRAGIGVKRMNCRHCHDDVYTISGPIQFSLGDKESWFSQKNFLKVFLASNIKHRN